MIAGQGNSYGMCIVRLKDWSERPDKADAVNAVIGQIYARTADIKDAQISPSLPDDHRLRYFDRFRNVSA
ncbi:hypothetical protein OBE_02417, partial [human gut metagenome]